MRDKKARTPWCSRTTRGRVAVLCDHRQVLVSCGAQVLKYYCTRMFSRHHVGWMNNIGSILLFELIEFRFPSLRRLSERNHAARPDRGSAIARERHRSPRGRATSLQPAHHSTRPPASDATRDSRDRETETDTHCVVL